MALIKLALLSALLITIFPGCRKKTRHQKKIDKANKEKIIRNF